MNRKSTRKQFTPANTHSDSARVALGWGAATARGEPGKGAAPWGPRRGGKPTDGLSMKQEVDWTTSGAAAALLQGDPDTQEAPQALSPSQPRRVTRGSAGQDQAPGAEQQSLVIPAAESPSTLHLTASPQSPATIQSTSTVLSTVMVQSTVTTLSKETVQMTTAVQSTVTATAAASERPPPVLSGLPSTPLQDTQPSLVPPRPPRPPRAPPSQSHTDVLPVARPIVVPSTQPARPTAVTDGPPAAPPTQPPTVLEQSGVGTATSLTPPVQSSPSPTELTEPSGTPEKQASLVTEHVQRSSTVPPPKSPAVPETSDEAPLQPSAPAVTTPSPSGPCQMSKTQFLAQLSVVPLVRDPPRVEEDEEGERLSPLPAMSTEAVITRSVATETTPAKETKEEIVVQVGGRRKSSPREAILSGLRLRLRPRPQDSATSPVVAKKPRGDRTAPLDHDYSKVMQNGGEKSSESHVDQDVVEDTTNGVTADDKSTGQGSSNQVISEEEGGANTDVTSPTRQSPIGGGGGVSKSKKRNMTWVQAQRLLALAQAKRSRSKVTKTSQRGLRSELRGLVTQFLPSNPQRRLSYSPSPHATSTSSPRRTSPRQATRADTNPSPATAPHSQPHQFKVTSTTSRRGRPRSGAVAALNLKRSPSNPQPIPFIVKVSPRSGFKKSPQCMLTLKQGRRYRQSQPMWSPPGPFQHQQSPQSPRKRLAKNQCADCGRVLSSGAALESHASLHTGKRPFACSACGKDFPNLKGLNRHARVHGDQRGHQCPQCDKTFVYRFGLTKHEQLP
ncbi:hypothetical protein J4Q44_G00039320 [Coregonus suidteri]|uniref:C2H2-type domain-containing protein n=1 Tax=Coregonus suidteri TaxID=861788 RepID=A0AAN8R195_9TELE